VSGLLAVVAMACVLKLKCPKSVSGRLSQKFGKLWLAAEVILFVLVGAAVDIRYTLAAGLPALLMIFVALAFRTVGVLICVAHTALYMEGKAVLCHRVSSKGYSSGSHRISSACGRAGMW